MNENAAKMAAEQPHDPLTAVFGEFAAACSAFVDEASKGEASDPTLTRLARAVEALSREQEFQAGTTRGNA